MIVFPILLSLLSYFVPASILVRPEYIISFYFALVSFSRKKGIIVRKFKTELVLFALLSLFSCISIFSQTLFGKQIVWRDLMILVRYLYYASAILAGAYFASKLSNHRYFLITLYLLIPTSIAISVLQYFNISGLNTSFVSIYGQNYQTLITGDFWRRIIGTVGNPNYWGLVLNFCVILCIYKVLFCKKIVWIAFVPPLLASILYTGSRTAIVSLVVSSLAFLYLSRKTKKVNISMILTAVAVLFVGSMLVKTQLHSGDIEVYENKDRFSVENMDTFYYRIEHWKKIFARLYQNPVEFVVGGGPSKAHSIRWGDNMYIRYLRDWGIVGLLLYLYLIKTIFYKSRKAMDIKPVSDGASIFLWALICLLVFDFAADGWFNVRITGFMLFSYGYILMAAHSNIQGNKVVR